MEGSAGEKGSHAKPKVKGKESLELLVGAQVRVFVVKADDKANGDQVVLPVVHEGTSVGVAVEGPSKSVHHKSEVVLLWVNLPNLTRQKKVVWVLGFT